MSRLSERDDTGKLPLTGADRAYLKLPDNSQPRKVNTYIRSMASHTHPPVGGRGFPVTDAGHFTSGGKYPAGHKKIVAQRQVSAHTRRMAEQLVDSLIGEGFPRHYEVSVGGVNRMIHSSRDEIKANACFTLCVELSKRNDGQIGGTPVAGEPVTLFCDDVPVKSYEGTIVANGAN